MRNGGRCIIFSTPSPVAHVWSSTSTSFSPEKKHKILSPFLAEKCTIVQCDLDVMFTLIILCCDHCLDQLISAMFLHGIYWIKLPAPQDKKLGEHWVERPNNWTRSDKFQKEPSNICLFYLGLIAVMHSKEKNNNTLKSYLLSNWKVLNLNFVDAIFTLHFNTGQNRTDYQAIWWSRWYLTLILSTTRYNSVDI